MVFLHLKGNVELEAVQEGYVSDSRLHASEDR